MFIVQTSGRAGSKDLPLSTSPPVCKYWRVQELLRGEYPPHHTTSASLAQPHLFSKAWQEEDVCLLMDCSCNQVEGMGVPRVEIHLGRGYLDIHLPGGVGAGGKEISRSPWQEERERNQRQASKTPTQFHRSFEPHPVPLQWT